MYIKPCPHGLRKALDSTQERTGNPIVSWNSQAPLKILKGYVDKAKPKKIYIVKLGQTTISF